MACVIMRVSSDGRRTLDRRFLTDPFGLFQATSIRRADPFTCGARDAMKVWRAYTKVAIESPQAKEARRRSGSPHRPARCSERPHSGGIPKQAIILHGLGRGTH